LAQSAARTHLSATMNKVAAIRQRDTAAYLAKNVRGQVGTDIGGEHAAIVDYLGSPGFGNAKNRSFYQRVILTPAMEGNVDAQVELENKLANLNEEK
jgi:hypothetical protein